MILRSSVRDMLLKEPGTLVCKFSLTPEGLAEALLCCVEDVASRSTGWRIFIYEKILVPPKRYLIESGL